MNTDPQGRESSLSQHPCSFFPGFGLFSFGNHFDLRIILRIQGHSRAGWGSCSAVLAHLQLRWGRFRGNSLCVSQVSPHLGSRGAACVSELFFKGCFYIKQLWKTDWGSLFLLSKMSNILDAFVHYKGFGFPEIRISSCNTLCWMCQCCWVLSVSPCGNWDLRKWHRKWQCSGYRYCYE